MFLDAADGFQAVEQRHRNINDSDHRFESQNFLDRRAAVFSLSDHLDRRLVFEQSSQPFPEKPVIVGQINGDFSGFA